MAPPKKNADDLKNQRIPIMMTEAELKLIDDWSFKHRIRSRGEAIRRLCQAGIVMSDSREKLQESAEKAFDIFSNFMLTRQGPAGRTSASVFLEDFEPELMEALGRSRLAAIMAKAIEDGQTLPDAIAMADEEKSIFGKMLETLADHAKERDVSLSRRKAARSEKGND